MRKLVLVLTLALVIFVALFRQRIFLRDPLATVTRDGVKVNGAVVMINYSNDVLLEQADRGTTRIHLVQNWNRVAEVPTAPLTCLQSLACMTDADQATAQALSPGSRGRRSPFEGVTMTNRRAEFVDEDGDLLQITLR